MELSTSLAGWHSRAISRPNSSSFAPSSDNFVFGVIRSTQVNPSGFLLAFFLPNVVVDTAGRALQLSDGEWDQFSHLAQDAAKRPQPGGFQNQWRIKQDRTSWPILQLHVKNGEEKIVSVYGFDGKSDKLEKTTVGRDTLPDKIMEFFGLVLEAKDNVEVGKPNVELLSKARTIVVGEE